MIELRRPLSTIRSIDEKLMRLLTVNWRYRDLDNRPQTRIAAVVTLAAISWTVAAIHVKSHPGIVISLFCCLGFWLCAFYEWRLWYRLRERRGGRDK